jgi:hypothetical protein
LIEFVDVDAEYVPIEEQQRAERLVLRRGRHVPLGGQPREKPGYFG